MKKDGVYQFNAWIASGTDPAGSVEIYLNGDENLIGAAQSVNEGWQTYKKVTAGSVEIKEGEHVIKVLFPSGAVNFQAIEVKRTGNIEVPTEPAPETEAPAVGDSGDNNAGADAGETPTAAKSDNGGGNNIIVFVIIGAVVVVAVIVIVVFVLKSKKKK